jgi:phosphinothricin acetyltransferase
VSSRCCYAGVAELSVYIGAEARGQGVGSELLAALIESSERAGIWTLQTGVFPENGASLALLRRFGFRAVGTQERIGRLHGVWRNVVLLERRSEVVTMCAETATSHPQPPFAAMPGDSPLTGPEGTVAR